MDPMKEVDLFGIYIAPAALVALVALVVFLFLRRWFDRIKIQRWVWHRPLFDTAVYVILLSLIGLLF
jgi:hypothetical protein